MSEDLTAVLAFLAKYQWLYDFKLTNIFVEKILDRIPAEVRCKSGF